MYEIYQLLCLIYELILRFMLECLINTNLVRLSFIRMFTKFINRLLIRDTFSSRNGFIPMF